MAFLHNGNLIPTTVFSFYPCDRDSVYLEGLREGESIQSEDPYFFQNANGYLAIDDRFKSLQITRSNAVIQSINLRWNKTCTNEQTEMNENIVQATNLGNVGFSSMMVFTAGIAVIVITKRFFHAHK